MLTAIIYWKLSSFISDIQYLLFTLLTTINIGVVVGRSTGICSLHFSGAYLSCFKFEHFNITSVLNVHRGDINIDSDSSLCIVCIPLESVPRQRNICVFHRISYFLVSYTESHLQVFLWCLKCSLNQLFSLPLLPT